MVEQWDMIGLLAGGVISFITLVSCLLLMRLSWSNLRKQLGSNVADIEQWRAKDDGRQQQR